MTPVTYLTEHQLSKIIGAAFAKGCRGETAEPPGLQDGPAAVYGILRGCGDIIRKCEWINRDYYYIDNGYFRPGHFDGFYRICKNGRQGKFIDNLSPERWESLGTDLRPWRRRGRRILVVPPSKYVAEFDHIDSDEWCRTICLEIANNTDRPIFIKGTKGRMDEALDNTWCLVTYNSNAACHALREGVPVIVTGDHIAKHVSWSFQNIESPWWPERQWWAWGVACQQYTLDEIRSGLAWNLIQKYG